MKTVYRSVTVSIVSLFVVACATRYQPDGLSGGYEETQLAEQTFLVSFGANGFSSTDDAYLFLLTRAAELSKEHGYEGFYLVAVENRTTTVTQYTQGVATTTSQASGEARVHGNQVTGRARATATTTYTPPQAYNVTHPAFSGEVLFVDERLDEESPEPFNAELLIEQGQDRDSEIGRRNAFFGYGTLVLGGVAVLAVIGSS